jgi:hypothetical protein
MKRFLVVLALTATACGSVTVSPGIPAVGDEPNATSNATESGDDTNSTSDVTESGDDTNSTSDVTESGDDTSQSSDGRPAPDFVLALGEGGEFSPSSEDKPIYMVFWAEW